MSQVSRQFENYKKLDTPIATVFCQACKSPKLSSAHIISLMCIIDRTCKKCLEKQRKQRLKASFLKEQEEQGLVLNMVVSK